MNRALVSTRYFFQLIFSFKLGKVRTLHFSESEPIRPIRRIRKLRRDPETPGGPLGLKDIFTLVSLLKLASGYENMNYRYFNMVRCPPLYVKISQIM